MELSVWMKLRIAAVAAVGVILVGLIAWPWDNPPDPFGSVLALSIGINGAVTLVIMAFLAGFFGYFVAWPYGKEIGILAVPFGLILWAFRAGKAGFLMQFNPTLEQRMSVLSMLSWEPFFWLIVIAAGLAGVTLGQNIRPAGPKQQDGQNKSKSNYNKYLNHVLAVIVSFVIVLVCIRILAQNVVLPDNRAGSVVAQPAIGQIMLAVLVSFAIAGFVAKKFFEVNYYWPITAVILVTAYSIISYTRGQSLEYFAELWPGSYFPDAVLSILPVQMVVFGTLGSICGYWMAVSYQINRQAMPKKPL